MIALPGTVSQNFFAKSSPKNEQQGVCEDTKSSSLTFSRPDREPTLMANCSKTSRLEYLRNKDHKKTSVMCLQPEPTKLIDKRLAESNFHMTNELLKGINIAKEARAMRLNRRIMYKNAPL